MRVLVLGGGGFIGRHLADALFVAGHEVACASRDPSRARSRSAAAERYRWVEARFERMQGAEDWRELVPRFEVVANCVGILRPRLRESYDKVHCIAPGALARSCAAVTTRLIHVSALGLRRDARSGFLRSKLAGEDRIRASGADYCIVRPSLLDGEDGFGARWLRRAASWPVHLLPADAQGRIAPLAVEDLAEAMVRLCERRDFVHDREIELGGPDRRTIAEHLAALRRAGGRTPARLLRLPATAARALSHCCDLVHISPYSYGHLELMRRDNLPAHDHLRALLGRPPSPVGIAADPVRHAAALAAAQ